MMSRNIEAVNRTKVTREVLLTSFVKTGPTLSGIALPIYLRLIKFRDADYFSRSSARSDS
jgi:hypothetical protein